MVFEKYPHSVQFEDNLSSHKTPEVLAFWETIKCSQILYPPDLTHVLQPVDRHIGIQYKTAVYKAVRSRSMELLRAEKQPTNTRLSAMEKRIIITKAVAETHYRLARNGSFRGAFISTGSWLPADRSADVQVNLQGVQFDYKAICSQSAVEKHKLVRKAEEDARQAKRDEAARELEEKRVIRQAKFATTVENSKRIWVLLEPLVIEKSTPHFNGIAERVKGDFICAGSYPAYLVAQQMQNVQNDYEPVNLKFNDIDIYYGSFADGELERIKCCWAKINNIEYEVNLILCQRLNTEYLVSNFDINAVGVCVYVKILHNEVSSVE